MHRWVRQTGAGLAALAALWALAGCGAAGFGSSTTTQEPQRVSRIADTTRLPAGVSETGSRGTPETRPSAAVRDLVARRGLAYALVPDGLVVVELDRPEGPQVVGRQPLASSPLRLAVDGSHAFVACGLGGLQVVDVANPRQPALAGAWSPDAGELTAVDAANGVAVALVGEELVVLDVARPGQPAEVRRVRGLDGARDVRLAAGRAYVLAGEIAVVDVAVPSQAKVVAHLRNTAAPAALAFHNDRLLLLADNGLELLEVAEPRQPVRTAAVTADDLRDLARSAPAADPPAAALLNSGTGPESPAVVGGPPASAAASGAAGAGTATHQGIGDPDRTDTPGTLPPVSGLPPVGELAEKPLDDPAKQAEPSRPSQPAAAAPAARIAVSGDRVFVTQAQPPAVLVLGVESPGALRPLGAFAQGVQAAALAADGDRVLLGLSSGVLEIHRVAADGTAQRIGEIALTTGTPAAANPAASGSNAAPAPLAEAPEPSTARPEGAPRP